MKGSNLKYFALGLMLASAGLWALAVTIPNSFTAGTTISASQVNQNFQALKTAVDALEAKVNALGTNAIPAAKTGRVGYAWADQPASASYTPDPDYSFNSAAGAITATRSGAGDYAIVFSGLGGGPNEGGNVQVSAYGSGAGYCRVQGWASIGSSVTININCFNSAGVATDMAYTVLFFW